MRTLLVTLLFALALPAEAQPKLPEGAIARCGSLAWRHPGGITSLAYAGEQLVGAGMRGVRFWDAEGETRALVEGSASMVAASPDGKTVVAAGASLRWIDVASGKVTRTIKAKLGEFVSCTWSPDGQTVFAGTRTGELLAIAGDGSTRWQTTIKGSNITDVAVHPDGKTLAACLTGEATVGLFGAADGKRQRTFGDKRSWIYRVAWSSDGSLLAGGGANALLVVWNTEGKAVYTTPSAQLLGRRPTVGVAFARNAVVYGIRYADRIRMVRVDRDGAATPTFRSMPTSLRGAELAVSPDGQTMATSSGAVVIRVDLRQRRPIGEDLQSQQETTCLAWSRDGTQLVTGDFGLLVKSWTAKGERIATLEVKGDLLNGIDVSPDGTLVAVREEPPGQRLMGGEMIRVWRRADSKLLYEWPTGSRFGGTRPRFSPDGQWVAYGGNMRAMKLWNARTGAAHKSLRLAASSVQDYAWSADSKQLLTVCEGGKIEVWNATTGAQVAVKPAMKRDWTDKQEWRCAVSDDWSVAALALKTGEVVIRDVATGAIRGRIKAAGRGWPRVACSPDGKWIAITGPDASWRLVDARKGRLVRTVAAGAPVALLAFAKGGVLATAMRGGTTLIWKVR